MIEFTYKPEWLLVGGLAALAWVLLSYRLGLSRPRGIFIILFPALRLLTAAGIVVCLLDPQRVSRIEHQQPARLAVLVDTSKSMSIGDLPPTRLEACKNWFQSVFLPAKPSNLAVDFYRFDLHLASFASNSPAAEPAWHSAAANGKITDIANALENLLTTTDAGALNGVLLCSDGIANSGGDPATLAKFYRRKGIPIHTVTFGTTNEPQDIILENVQVKRAVPNQSPAKVTVKLRGARMQGRKVPVELKQGGALVSRAEVLLTGESQRVELSFTPFAKGFQVFEASVPPQPGEWIAGNNRLAFGLDVMEPKIAVIYMEGSPLQARQPEWKYLKDALESDPNIMVKAMYRPQQTGAQNVNSVDSVPGVPGARCYHVEHPTEGYPRTLAGLLQYDVVINSDIYKAAFSREQLENTAKLVEEYGGGFVMVGGITSFGSGGYHLTVLDRFIPVAMENDSDQNFMQFKMVVPQAAFSHPLMALGNTPQETKAIWTTKFPYLYGYNRVGRAKPGATVLGVDSTAIGPAGPRIIMAAQQVGRGRTMAFTSDITRGWGQDYETIWGEKIAAERPLSESNCDSRYYRRFWINAVRWLAAGKVSSSNAPVSMELSQSICRPGENVEATVRVLDQNFKVTGNAAVTLTLSSEGRTNQAFAATFEPASQLYRGTVQTPNQGDFIVTASATLGSLKRGEDKQLLTCMDSDLEMAQSQANPGLMASIARISGGTVVNPNDPAQLHTVFANVPPVTVEIRRQPLWDKAQWLALLTGLLTMEWILRRLHGLA